jgi:hypothetical protein
MVLAWPAAGTSVTVRLRHGLIHEAMVYRDAVLRPLRGADELALEEVEELPARRVTALLAAAVTSIGPVSPMTPGLIRRLTIGDRERLVFALHAATFGTSVDTVVTCPTCGTVTEVPLDLHSVLALHEHEPADAFGSFVVDGMTVRFRLPDGADHEQAAALALTSPEAAAAAMADACLVSVMEPGAVSPEVSSNRFSAALEAALQAADPDAVSTVTLACVGCDQVLRATLDGHALLHGGLRANGSVLEDVDRLALAYHWSEADILSLSASRRRRYLALLDRGAS